MTEPVPMTAASFLTVVDTLGADIPKVKAFILQMQANPTLITIASKLFPEMAPLIPIINEIGPWLDFFQQLVTAIQAATKPADA